MERVKGEKVVSNSSLWDKAAEEYRTNIGARVLVSAKLLVEELDRRSPITADSNILDVGTGAGNIPLAVRSLPSQARIVAVDSSPAMVELTRSRQLPGVQVGVSDARSLDASLVPEAAFSHAFASLLLQFVDEQQQDVLAGIYRALQPGGMVIISISHYLGIVEPFYAACKSLDPDYEPVKPFQHTWNSTKHVEQGLREAGFADVEAFEHTATSPRGPDVEGLVAFWMNMQNPGLVVVANSYQGGRKELETALREAITAMTESGSVSSVYAVAIGRKPLSG